MNYAYKKPSGEVVWRSWSLEELKLYYPETGAPPAEIEVEGTVARRSYQAERSGMQSTKGWPLTCVASGVNAAQAQELRDEFKRVGVPTEVTADGDPVYTSPEHRRRALRARGFFDRGAYY